MKIDGRTLDHKTLEHLRLAAVRRVVEDGEAPAVVVTQSMGLCSTSICRWLEKFEDGGLEALAEKIAAGPEPKLTDKQRQQVQRWIVGEDPRQYGFEFGLWTRQIVAELILKRMGASLGLTAVGRLLARLEITPQKPLRRAYERDPVAVKAWVKRQYLRLRHKARRNGATLFLSGPARTSRTAGLKIMGCAPGIEA